MKTYRTLKGGSAKQGKFIYRGQRFKFGELVTSEAEPVDGKGNSLVDCENPAFELVSDDAPARSATPLGKKTSVDFIELANNDQRTKPQIARDIKTKYEVAIDPRPIRKADLIAREHELEALKGKDAAMSTNATMTGLEAQEMLR